MAQQKPLKYTLQSIKRHVILRANRARSSRSAGRSHRYDAVVVVAAVEVSMATCESTRTFLKEAVPQQIKPSPQRMVPLRANFTAQESQQKQKKKQSKAHAPINHYRFLLPYTQPGIFTPD